MATFGKTSLGTSVSATAYSQCHFGTAWSMPESGTITGLTGYVAGGPTNTQTVRLCAYQGDGTGGDPYTLLGYTSEYTVAVSQAAGWVSPSLATSSFYVPQGTIIWLDYFYGYTDASSFLYRESTQEGAHSHSVYSENLDSPGDGPANPWAGTTTEVTRSYCVYATYTPSGGNRSPLIQFGVA